MRGVGVACTVGGHDVCAGGREGGDLSGSVGAGCGGEWDVYVTRGMNTSATQKASARRDEEMRRRRSCFVAKREVEETNLGMLMTKKTGGGQYHERSLYPG